MCWKGFWHEDKDGLEQKISQILNYLQLPYAKKKPGLFWHVPSEYRDTQEKDVCERFARSLSDQGMGNIRDIRKYHHPDNSDKDFPDCIAEMDGKKIGIEVTELRKNIDSRDNQTRYREWKPGQFREEILEIVKRKNEKAQIPGRGKLLESLDQLYVVIYTDEPALSPENIREYLKRPVGPKPCKIDEAFVLGPYEPAENAHVSGRENEPTEPRAEHTAFQIQWESEDRN